MAEQNNTDFFSEISALYGKMDKLLDKRGPDALVEPVAAEAATGAADFPRLTEVVEAAPPKPALRQAAAGTSEIEPSPALMAAVEARLFELLARHRQEMDEAVRRIVQEELARRGK